MKMKKENKRVGNKSFFARVATMKKKKDRLSSDLKTPRRQSAGNDPSRRLMITPETLVSELPKDRLKTIDYLKVDSNNSTSENEVSTATKENKHKLENEGLLRVNDKNSEQANETSDSLVSLEKQKNTNWKMTLPNDSTVVDKVNMSKKTKIAFRKLPPIKMIETHLKKMRISVQKLSPISDRLATLLKMIMIEVEKVSPVDDKLETYLKKMMIAVQNVSPINDKLETRLKKMMTTVQKVSFVNDNLAPNLKKKRKVDSQKDSSINDNFSTSLKKIAIDNVSPVNDKLATHLTKSTTGLQKESPVDDKFKTTNEEGMTLFLANLPLLITRRRVEDMFLSFGELKYLRLRPTPFEYSRGPETVAAMRGETLPERRTVGYVRFANKSSAFKALELNGTTVDGLVLRIEILKECNVNKEKCVCLNNLAANTEEIDIRSHFQNCGPIQNVYLVCDGFSEVGHGKGYVEFEKKESVELALKMNASILRGQSVQVTRCRIQGNRITDILNRQW